MHTSIIGWAALATLITTTIAHPELHDHEAHAKSHTTHNTIRARTCSGEHVARRQANLNRRRKALFTNRGVDISKRDIYSTIQNTTCLLAPETIWGPYGVDGEIKRHDVREDEPGIDFYLDIGVMDVETCEPLPNTWLTIWSCNATGSYSGFTGVDPDTVQVMDGWTSREDGTTDDKTFLRGISKTDEDGMTEFLTVFPGYYSSRTGHIHVTVQTNVTGHNTSYSSAAIQHIGQLFFTEELMNNVYQIEPYSSHLATLNRTTNSEDSVLSVADTNGYSPFIDVQYLGRDISEGLVGYITIGVNRTASGRETTGTDVNVIGAIPTVSLTSGAQAAAATVDAAEGYDIADEV